MYYATGGLSLSLVLFCFFFNYPLLLWGGEVGDGFAIYGEKGKVFFFFCRSDKMARNVFASLIILMGGIKPKKRGRRQHEKCNSFVLSTCCARPLSY